MTPGTERRLLQIAVGVACLVPLTAGTYGMLRGVAAIDASAATSGAFDAHFRYLSGLLCGIGIAFAVSIPRIETHGQRFKLLTAIVFLGGLARLGAYVTGVSTSMDTILPLGMELVVTPLLALWQVRVARSLSA